MPTRKVADNSELNAWTRRTICRHPDHNPPSHCVFTPGFYVHECPSCGQKTNFNVRPSPSLSSSLFGVG